MRLISAKVSNYRVHKEVSVDLDAPLVLIGGPNECGKSTLAEAMHRALFLRCRATGKVLEGMQNLHAGGAPEVELRLEVGGHIYTIIKRFSGNSGTARLVREGGEALQGEAAESRLHELLGATDIGGGRGVELRLPGQWSHLWVWQGDGGQNPERYAADHASALIQRLAEVGGGAVLQSGLDSKLAQQFSAKTSDLWTGAGRRKAGSGVEKAEIELAEAQHALNAARERLQELEGHIEAHRQAQERLEGFQRQEQVLQEDSEELEKRAAEVAQLQPALQLQQEEVKRANLKIQKLEGDEAEIGNLEKQIAELREKLGPLEDQTRQKREALQAADRSAAEALQAQDRAQQATRQLRKRQDLLRAQATRFQREQEEAALRQRWQRVEELTAQRDGLAKQLAQLPALDAAAVKELRRLQEAQEKAEVRLKALAASIQLESSDGAVTVDGQALTAGTNLIITNRARLQMGSTVLHIQPGGGQDLTAATSAHQDAREAFRRALEKWGITTLIEAEEISSKRDEISNAIKLLEVQISPLKPADFPEILTRATHSLTAAQADFDRLHRELPEEPLLATQAEVALALRAREEETAAADSTETQTIALRNEANRLLETCREALQRAETALANSNNELALLANRVQVLTEKAGDAATRSEQLAGARQELDAAQTQLQSTTARLQDLHADALPADRERLNRAKAILQQNQKADENTLAISGAALQSDGSQDPKVTLDEAQARVDVAQENLAGVTREARATQLVDQLFRECQQDISNQFSKPLAEKVGDYLKRVLGSDVRAQVALNGNAFEGIQLVRGTYQAALNFDVLSGGAKEQVSAAMRLAMAEILAANHHGCLPIIFDDAFTNCDPARVRAVQAMLDTAAQRGLQVIVLSCNPSDYTSLGARTVMLQTV